MRALSLQQPWADAIASGLKPVENRTWPPWPGVLGETIAIHASASPRRSAEAQYRRLAGRAARPLRDMPLGCVIATARVVGALHVSSGRAVGDLTERQRSRVLSSPWTEGPWAWLLDQVRALDASVPCRGALSLWVVPATVLRRALASVHGRGHRERAAPAPPARASGRRGSGSGSARTRLASSPDLSGKGASSRLERRGRLVALIPGRDLLAMSGEEFRRLASRMGKAAQVDRPGVLTVRRRTKRTKPRTR